MSGVTRIDPLEAHGRVEEKGSLLVCAYDSDERFRSVALENAIPLSELRRRTDSLPKDREIIFYCA